MANIHQYVAGGNIYPCRFITQSSSAPFTVTQATADATIIVGISAEGTSVVPIDGYTDASSVYAATAGLPVPYWGEHDECLLEVAEACDPGDLLSPDANGKGVVSSTAGAPIGARALEPATAAGQKIRVAVEFQRVVAS